MAAQKSEAWSPSAFYQSLSWNLTLSTKSFEFLEYLRNWTFCVAALYWRTHNGGVIISSCVRAGTRAPLYWGANKQTAELRRNPMQAKPNSRELNRWNLANTHAATKYVAIIWK